MTIGGFGRWMKKPNVQIESETLPPSKIRGKIIPIDIMGIMYQYRFGPRKAVFRNINPFTEDPDELAADCKWFDMLISKLVKWIRHFGFIPLFVFDGKPRPLKIQKELRRRKEKENKVENRIQELKAKYAGKRSLVIPDSAKLELRKLRAGHHLVPRESANRFKKFFQDLGVPTITVSGDAERFCALYSAKHKVPAMSRDRDCFAFGTHSLIIDEVNYKAPDSQCNQWAFEIIRTNRLLAKLEMDYDNFVDLCIFAGTDYNDNIPKLSFGKGIPLIRKHKYLENFPMDVSKLNYVEVRKEFEQVDPESLIVEGSMEVDFDESRMDAALEEYDLKEWKTELLRAHEVLGSYRLV